MKKLFVSLVTMTLLFFGNLAFAQEQASKPTFMEGDSWQFNTSRGKVSSTRQSLGITQLDYTQGKVKAFSVEGDQKGEITLFPGESTSQALLARLGLSEELQSLRFPLSGILLMKLGRRELKILQGTRSKLM
jgi:hypothetical protein